MYSEYLMIGEVLRPQGVRGQVKVRPETDDPARFLDLEQVYLKTEAGFVPCAISQTDVRTDGFVYCVLSNAADRNAAEAQRGWLLYIDRAHAVPLGEGQYFISDLIDCRVQDRQGKVLGRVRDVLQPGANDVYEITLEAGGTMYLPVLPFVILSVDVRAGVIIVDESRLPEVAVLED